MNKAAMFTSKTCEWETPQELFDELNRRYHFTVDVCATEQNAKCNCGILTGNNKNAGGVKTGYESTIRKLECCATPGGCIKCTDGMDTTGCAARLYREAAEALKSAVAEIAALKHALAKVDIDCAYCAHKEEHARECIAADCGCERCAAEGQCACRKCHEVPGRCWVWNGGEYD